MKKTINNFELFFLCLLILIGGCTSGVDSKIKSIKEQNSAKPMLELAELDQLYESLTEKKDKVKVLESIESLIRSEIRDPNLLLLAYEKKAFYSSSVEERNNVYLKMAQLSVQNLRDNTIAQDYLYKIDEKALNKEQRDQFYQLKILSFINSGQVDQAEIEAEDLLNRPDLTPTERFKVSMLKTRILTANNKENEVEEILVDLLKTYPNLSMKWRVRSQLAMYYEEQENYEKALEQLNKMLEEEGDDELLSIRIEQLKERSKQQPGARGWYRR
jgi:outer membrane PBP1 activator LpoA protein